MNSVAFNKIFDQEFAAPLIAEGFRFVRKTKTLQYTNGTRDLRIMRMSSKWPHPGIMFSAIVFRHSFLRFSTSDDPNEKHLAISDFSRRLRFQDFQGWRKPKPPYRPYLTDSFSKDEFAYGERSESAVAKHLRKGMQLVKDRVRPWADTLTEKGELEQLSALPECAWCEKRWIEDYKEHIATKGRA